MLVDDEHRRELQHPLWSLPSQTQSPLAATSALHLARRHLSQSSSMRVLTNLLPNPLPNLNPTKSTAHLWSLTRMITTLPIIHLKTSSVLRNGSCRTAVSMASQKSQSLPVSVDYLSEIVSTFKLTPILEKIDRGVQVSQKEPVKNDKPVGADDLLWT